MATVVLKPMNYSGDRIMEVDHYGLRGGTDSKFELSDFPSEIKKAILYFYASTASVNDLLAIRLVCKEWLYILEIETEINQIWRDATQTRFRLPNVNKCIPGPSDETIEEEGREELYSRLDINWRERYMNYCMLQPLIQAIKDNRMTHIKELITRGVDLNLSYCDSFTPLHHAINLKLPGIALFLLENGFSRVNATDLRGETPLHRAAWNDQLDVAKKLVLSGGNLEAKNFFGYTPLHLASANGRVDMVRFLLDQGANIDVKSNVGNTPLHRAKCRGHPRVVKLLLDRGADQTIRNDHGKLAADYSKITRKNHKLDFT